MILVREGPLGVLFGTFPIFLGFPDLVGDAPGIFPIRPFLFLGLLRPPTRNSPERVRDTIWTFPQKSGKPPGFETPRFSFSQNVLKTAPIPNKIGSYGTNPEGPERHLDAARQKLPRDNFCRSIAAPLPSPRGQF